MPKFNGPALCARQSAMIQNPIPAVNTAPILTAFLNLLRDRTLITRLDFNETIRTQQVSTLSA